MRTKSTCLAALLAVLSVLALGACGSDDEMSSVDGQEVDGMFIAGMVPHHESAIEMAEIARKRGEHKEIRQLAGEIISAQKAEIADLEADHKRIFGEPLGQAEHEEMEMDAEMPGETDMTALEDADRFDKAFIDMMIPHHQGAIEMARMELDEGEDAELKQLAQQIIDAQSAEIDEMNSWRTDWYGEPSPAGGVPPEDSSDSMMEMDH